MSQQSSQEFQTILTRLDQIRTEMDGRFGQMDGRFGQMDGRLTRIDERLDQIQGISSYGNACAITFNFGLGHGFFAQDEKCNVYLFTAAHVVVYLTSRSNTSISIIIDNTTPISLSWTDIYCSKKYVEDGTYDIGCVKLCENSKNCIFQHVQVGNMQNGWNFKLEPFGWHQQQLSGRLLTAQGSDIFMSGCVTSFAGGRASVQAHSAPGCSGTPLFLDGHLVAICHGESKHRTHSSRIPSGLTPFVFVDVLPDQILHVKKEFFEILQSLEDISPEVFERFQPKVNDLLSLAPSLVIEEVWQKIIDSSISRETLLSYVMVLAVKKIWQEETPYSLSLNSLTVLSRKNK